MKLRFIIGGSGSGKSSTLQEEIISRSVKEPERQFFVVVPDQFTMQTQKEIVERHPAGGIMNVDVQSFGRLCYRISSELGEKERLVLDDTGKNLVLKHLSADLEGRLPAIGSSLSRKGYIHEVKSVISEFMQYGIDPEGVGRLSAYSSEKKALSAKLDDLKTVYEAFCNYLGERYITKEEKLDILAGQIERSGLLRGSVVAFDGFTGFTPVQENVIVQLMGVCEEMIFTVIMPSYELDEYRSEYDDHRLFALSMKTIRGLEQLARDAGAERGEDILLGDGKRFENAPALAFLDKHIFRKKDEIYKGRTEGQLALFAAPDPQEEINEIFRRIRKLTLEKGLAYRDIAVITGDLERYSPYVQEAAADQGIPVFVDINQKIEHDPFTEYLRSAMECVDRGFAVDNVLHFLRSGMSGIDDERADELENYLLATGIRGAKAWSRLFVRRPSYMKDDEEALSRINETRQQIWEKLECIRIPGRRAKADVYAKALYDLIVRSDSYEKLMEYVRRFRETGDQVREKEYSQIYEAICHLLEQCAALLKDEEISLKEFIEIYLSGIEEIKLGVLPMDVDRVVIGDMERTRLKPVKVVFFAGLNDGIIPGASSGGGMISDIDREFLEGSGFVLAPTPRQKMFIQRLYLYHALGRASQQLVLSYSVSDNKGDPIRPSYLVARICELFEDLKKERAGRSDDELPGSGEFAVMLADYASGTMPEEKKREFYTDYAILKERNADTVRRLTDAAFYRYIPATLEKTAAKGLYGDMISGSVSRMESFAACAYAHFLNYGLKLRKRESNEIEALDMGEIYHSVLDRFGKELENRGLEWGGIKADAVDEILPVLLEETAAEFGLEKLYQNAGSAYMFRRMSRILRRSIMTVAYQLGKGAFKPAVYEHKFRKKTVLDDGTGMILSGKIDRLDKYTDDGKTYIKITDYKSGNRTLKPEKICSGEQLQLPVYLYEAVQESGEDAVPAALFYYILKDPVISLEDKDAGELDKYILKELKPKGLISGDIKVINALDGNIRGWSDVVSVALNKDGGISGQTRCTIPPEDMKALTGYAYKKLLSLGKEIASGRIAKGPVDAESCKYCDHRDECMFDTSIPGCVVNEQKMSAAEAMEHMRQVAGESKE